MTISNLKQSEVKTNGKTMCRLSCSLSSDHIPVKEVWFETQKEFGGWLTDDVYDAFLVAMLYPAMFYGEDIEIKGCVSEKIYRNICEYVQSIVIDFHPFVKKISVKVDGFKDAAKLDTLHVGTGFSGGVDSYSTLTDRLWNYQGTPEEKSVYCIDTLFFFHLGQYGNVTNRETWERMYNRFTITEAFAAETGLKAIFLNTNLFDFYRPDWEYHIGVLNRVAAILVFQKALVRYYLSNDVTYGEMINWAAERIDLADFADPYMLPLLSPRGLDIVCEGAQYKRTKKTERIADNKYAQRLLNVCINTEKVHVGARNCGRCMKCLRTMMALDNIGKLDDFHAVFNRDDWEKGRRLFVSELVLKYGKNNFATDSIDFARQHGMKIPGKTAAMAVVYADKFRRLPKKLSRALHKDS